MAPDGYLRGVLADGSRPFGFRAGVRELLGAPDDNGVRVAFPPRPPRGGFRYVRQHPAAPGTAEWDDGSYWLAETDDFEFAPAPVREDGSDATERWSDHLKHAIEPPATANAAEPVRSGTAATVVEPARRPVDARVAEVPPADAGAVEPATAAPPSPPATQAQSPGAPGTSAPASGSPRPTSNLIPPAERPGPLGLAGRQDAPAGRPEPAVAATATPVGSARPAARSGPERPPETPRPAPVTGRTPAAPRPIRTLRAAAPAVRPEWKPDHGLGAVQSVVASNRPPHRQTQTPRRDVTVVETPPVVAQPSAPPQIVVVHAPDEAVAVPAFWERRNLGRLTNRIVR
ncbi:hypothetical protein [Amycolatopsis sp. RTGN1]|uniref:hypothetical protein n=1 Tax=Amycolatopsis ponsaeliensis TaxID=2992142 RepID=UPI00254E7BBE|nr:hypothetical protein [Amycolatopsis sp. RTGN1]